MQFCDDHNIPYQKKGKVIVATNHEELPRLEEIARRGKANGIPHLELIGPEKLRDIEPYIEGIKALWVPECHIINFTLVAEKLAELLTHQGCIIRFNEKVKSISDYPATKVINCAGLHSDRLAPNSPHRILPFRGEYYLLKKRELIKGLIYPVPDPKFPFLGVHITRMINGHIAAGPNAVLALSREGYKKITNQHA